MEATIKKLANVSAVIPYFEGTIPAGFPSPAQDYSEEDLDLSKLLQPNPASTFIIRISGDSMEGAKMANGSLAIVDRSAKPQSGDIVVAVLNGEFTVKRLVKNSRNWILHPENPLYRPIIITEEMSFQVWGVVTFTIIDQRKIKV